MKKKKTSSKRAVSVCIVSLGSLPSYKWSLLFNERETLTACVRSTNVRTRWSLQQRLYTVENICAHRQRCGVRVWRNLVPFGVWVIRTVCVNAIWYSFRFEKKAVCDGACEYDCCFRIRVWVCGSDGASIRVNWTKPTRRNILYAIFFLFRFA